MEDFEPPPPAPVIELEPPPPAPLQILEQPPVGPIPEPMLVAPAVEQPPAGPVPEPMLQAPEPEMRAETSQPIDSGPLPDLSRPMEDDLRPPLREPDLPRDEELARTEPSASQSDEGFSLRERAPIEEIKPIEDPNQTLSGDIEEASRARGDELLVAQQAAMREEAGRQISRDVAPEPAGLGEAPESVASETPTDSFEQSATEQSNAQRPESATPGGEAPSVESGDQESLSETDGSILATEQAAEPPVSSPVAGDATPSATEAGALFESSDGVQSQTEPIEPDVPQNTEDTAPSQVISESQGVVEAKATVSEAEEVPVADSDSEPTGVPPVSEAIVDQSFVNDGAGASLPPVTSETDASGGSAEEIPGSSTTAEDIPAATEAPRETDGDPIEPPAAVVPQENDDARIAPPTTAVSHGAETDEGLAPTTEPDLESLETGGATPPTTEIPAENAPAQAAPSNVESTKTPAEAPNDAAVEAVTNPATEPLPSNETDIETVTEPAGTGESQPERITEDIPEPVASDTADAMPLTNTPQQATNDAETVEQSVVAEEQRPVLTEVDAATAAHTASAETEATLKEPVIASAPEVIEESNSAEASLTVPEATEQTTLPDTTAEARDTSEDTGTEITEAAGTNVAVESAVGEDSETDSTQLAAEQAETLAESDTKEPPETDDGVSSDKTTDSAEMVELSPNAQSEGAEALDPTDSNGDGTPEKEELENVAEAKLEEDITDKVRKAEEKAESDRVDAEKTQEEQRLEDLRLAKEQEDLEKLQAEKAVRQQEQVERDETRAKAAAVQTTQQSVASDAAAAASKEQENDDRQRDQFAEKARLDQIREANADAVRKELDESVEAIASASDLDPPVRGFIKFPSMLDEDGNERAGVWLQDLQSKRVMGADGKLDVSQTLYLNEVQEDEGVLYKFIGGYLTSPSTVQSVPRDEEQERKKFSGDLEVHPDAGYKDDVGHLWGNRFGAPDDVRNYMAQNRSINRGEFNQIEERWANLLEQNPDMKINIFVCDISDGLYAENNFDPASVRPYERYVNWVETYPDGKKYEFKISIPNTEPGQEQKGKGGRRIYESALEVPTRTPEEDGRSPPKKGWRPPDRKGG